MHAILVGPTLNPPPLTLILGQGLPGTYRYFIECHNSDYPTVQDESDEIIVLINSAPVANAGADQLVTLPQSSLSVTGTATDVDGNPTIMSTVWSEISGPSAATITNGSTLTPTFSNMIVAGDYVFRLTVTDDLGLIGTDDMTISV